MHDLIKAMNDGEAVVYPTETLYAIGCDATNVDACQKVIDIKARPDSKPLPLIVGSVQMLDLVTDEKPAMLQELAASFWPGPISILVKALPSLPKCLSDENGYTSVRWSGHPFASELSRRMRKPLIATSANLSGKPPVALPEDLDSEMLDKVGAAYFDPPWPKGGLPSTVVGIKSFNRLEVLREGAVTIKMLCDKGFSVTLAQS